MQLVHATQAALELGVDRIYVPAIPWFGGEATETRVGGLTYVAYEDLDEVVAPALFGTFLFEDLEPAVAVLAGELRQRLVDRHVSSLFAPPPLAEPRPPNHVAVHIRSGDLFDRADPHPNFVQPPLAYYTTALRHFAAPRTGVHVTLVYEDEGNPVIAALRAFSTHAGFRTRSRAPRSPPTSRRSSSTVRSSLAGEASESPSRRSRERRDPLLPLE